MKSPALAPVAPRVLSPVTGEPLPLVDELRELLSRHPGAPIRIVGGPGAGKSTALAHVEATLGPLSITILDEPSDEDLQLTRILGKQQGLTMIYSASRGVRFDEGHVELDLAPWGIDEAIEYLRAVYPDRCGAVVRRLLGAADANFAQGNPELWRTALDSLALSDEASGVRAALRYEIGGLLLDDGAWKRAGELCLVEMLFECLERGKTSKLGRRWLDDARQRAGEFRKAARNRDEKRVVRLLRHDAVRSLLAAEFVRTSLAEDDDQPYLVLPLPETLMEAIGPTLAADEACLERLHEWLYRDEKEAHPTAASLLLAANPDWRPPRTRPHYPGGRFPNANWSGANLAEAILARARLEGADLSQCKLDNANLRKCDLRRAVLRDASLAEAMAMDANLQGANLSFAKAPKAIFIRASLRGVRAEGAMFDQADFTQADLREGNFRSAKFVRALFGLARLDEADFENTDFSGARLSGLDFTVVSSLDAAIFFRANLKQAKFERLKLTDAKFHGANLQEALFTGSRMPRGDFVHADLRGAKMADIHWPKANLCHADLRGVSFHMGSSRSGLVGSPIACEGSRTGFYTDDFHDMSYKRPEEIRKANLRGADLRGANLDKVDFYLVDLRDALFDARYEPHLRRCGAILEEP